MCLAHSKVVDEFADQTELPPFAAGLVDTINKAAAAMSLSIGHRLGLFDSMRSGDAKSPAGWANALGLQERYVAARATRGAVHAFRLITFFQSLIATQTLFVFRASVAVALDHLREDLQRWRFVAERRRCLRANSIGA